MNLQLKNITESDYNNSNAKVLFNGAELNRSFAKIDLGQIKFKLAWQSDLVEPLLLELDNGLFCIGIDLNFVIVDSNTSTILLKLELNDLFKTVRLLDTSILIATDMEVVEVSRKTYEVINKTSLPDMFEDFIDSDNGIEALCFDEMRIPIKINH